MSVRVQITAAGGTPEWALLAGSLALPVVTFLCISAVALWAIKVTRSD